MKDQSKLNLSSLLSTRIVEEFTKIVTGTQDREYYYSNEVNEIMVGILEPAKQEDSNDLSGSDDKFFKNISSIGINFRAKNDLEIVTCVFSGLVFFRVKPSYSEELVHYLENLSQNLKMEFKRIEDVEKYVKDNPLSKIDTKTDCLRKFKRISLSDLLVPQRIDFKIHGPREQEVLCKRIEQEVSDNIDLFCVGSSRYKINQISYEQLLNQSDYDAFMDNSVEFIIPKWNPKIDIRTKKDKNGDIQVFVSLINNTPDFKTIKNSYNGAIFDAEIRLFFRSLNQVIDVKTEFSKDNYKKSKPIKAIMNNAGYNDDFNEQSVFTTNIPTFLQYRLVTKDHLNELISFKNLIQNPLENLNQVKVQMEKDYQRLLATYLQIKDQNRFSQNELKRYESDLQKYLFEINRFSDGIELIRTKTYTRKAFVAMNHTFSLQLNPEQKTYPGWRLFQIVFIVSLIGDIVKNEYKLDGDKIIDRIDPTIVDLLFFPTGGGKTESFLGCVMFALFFDRYRGKQIGVNTIIKYPLRLLSIQQLERTLVLIVKANVVKSTLPEIANTKDFELGYFVGESNTPNKIDEKFRQEMLRKSVEEINETIKIIQKCPMCGKEEINIAFDDETWILKHVCSNPKCTLGTLPILIVDSEIYRKLPDVIVSTMDKLANIGLNPNYKNLLGMAHYKCKKHGFSSRNECLVANCTEKLEDVIGAIKDPLPSLFIQDELHLVRESLGTFASHYETFVAHYCENLTHPSFRRTVKYIGATATITEYEKHINELYASNSRRFPTTYPHETRMEDFYSKTLLETDISRVILGFAPRNKSVTDSVQEVSTILRKVVFKMLTNVETELEHYKHLKVDKSELKKLLLSYWISIIYTNSKDDSVKISNLVQNQGNNELRLQNIPEFEITSINSDISFQDIRKILNEIETSTDIMKTINMIISTSTISHGIDEDEFNQISFFGIPNNTAEYIQAYSRVGRKYTGIVVDVIRLVKERDKSYLKNFLMFHDNKETLIDPVPINRWAKNAIYSTLPGILQALIIQYYEPKMETNFFNALQLREAILQKKILVSDVIEQVIKSYKCQEIEPVSAFYKEIISEEISRMFDFLIKDVNLNRTDRIEKLFTYSSTKKTAMTSLRDIEKGLLIRTR